MIVMERNLTGKVMSAIKVIRHIFQFKSERSILLKDLNTNRFKSTKRDASSGVSLSSEISSVG